MRCAASPTQHPPLTRSLQGDGFHITLDGRTLRTPARAELRLPSLPLALAVAAEWEWQDAKNIRPFTMPLMALCSTAIDRVPVTRGTTVASLLRFFETDALCVRSEHPLLAARQAAAWDPLLEWAGGELGARPNASASIFGPQQPPAVVEAFTRALAKADDWQLAGITAASAAARSLVMAFALARGRVRPADAPPLLRVDEDFQTDEWGVVEGGHDIDAADLRARCASAAVFLELLRDRR